MRENFMTAKTPLPLCLVAALLVWSLAAPASAQQQPAPRVQAPPAASAPKAAAPPREAAAGGDAALRQRIEQLEEQLVDMQVVVGTLESLARGATAPAPSAGRQPVPGP